MVLGKLPMPGHPTNWIVVGQGLTALTVGAGGGCLDIFSLVCRFSLLSPSLWETARYRLKYCLKGPLSPKQSTNQLRISILIVEGPQGGSAGSKKCQNACHRENLFPQLPNHWDFYPVNETERLKFIYHKNINIQTP